MNICLLRPPRSTFKPTWHIHLLRNTISTDENLLKEAIKTPETFSIIGSPKILKNPHIRFTHFRRQINRRNYRTSSITV